MNIAATQRRIMGMHDAGGQLLKYKVDRQEFSGNRVQNFTNMLGVVKYRCGIRCGVWCSRNKEGYPPIHHS